MTFLMDLPSKMTDEIKTKHSATGFEYILFKSTEANNFIDCSEYVMLMCYCFTKHTPSV